MTDPKLLPLAHQPGARYDSLTVDARLVNAFAEKSAEGEEIWVYKRPGFATHDTLAAGTGRGIYNWNGHLYSIVGTTVYKDTVALAGAVVGSEQYTFSSSLGANPLLFIHNSTNAYVVTEAGVLAPVVDINYPPTTVPGSVYIDGTTYVMEPGSARIGGSTAAANDPTTWDPLNRILAQIEPNFGIGIAKQLVYLIALKQFYTEAFYDAGNPTGSPLASVQGAKVNYGCIDARTVCSCGGDLVWVARTREGEVCVVMMSALQVRVISSPREDRILSAGNYFGNVYSWSMKCGGHRFYGLTITASNLTLVFDITSGMWYQWKTPTGSYLPYCSATVDQSGTFAVFLHESNGKTYAVSLDNLGDDAAAFQVDIYTPNFDGGTYRSKTLGRLDVLGDMVRDSVVFVETSDDDYGTWGPTQQLDMSQPRPFVTDLGEFYRRAFHFSHKSLTHFRLKAIELYLELGTA